MRRAYPTPVSTAILDTSNLFAKPRLQNIYGYPSFPSVFVAMSVSIIKNSSLDTQPFPQLLPSHYWARLFRIHQSFDLVCHSLPA